MKKNKLKNILRAGIISLLFVFGNPSNQVKAQDNYTSKYNTIGHEAIRIYNGEESQRYLDNLIDSTSFLFTKKNFSEREGRNLMIKIDSILDKNFKYFNESSTHCLDKSLGYLAIARKNNLPLEIVYVPKLGGHVYLRWDSDGKHNPLNSDDIINKGDFEWEATSGKFVIDNQYKTSLISNNSIKKGIYLTNLTDFQIISKAYYAKAVKFANKGEFENAIKNFDLSLDLDSNDVKSYYAKGFCYNKLGEYNEANKYFNKALKLNPEAEIYFSKASNHRDMFENKKAISCYDSVIEISKKIMNETYSYTEKERMRELKKSGLFWKSLTYTRMNKEKKAETTFEKFKRE